MYAIVGATGNTGKIIAQALLDHGQKVRVIGRDANRLNDFARKGAEPFTADATDPDALTKAFAGAKAVYVMIPPNPSALDVAAYQEQVSSATAAAIEKAGVEYAVLLSSVGADKESGTGPVVGLHNFEKKLNAINRLNVLCLRAGYFMENLLPQVQVIKAFGMMGGPLHPNRGVPMIATQDIGASAAEALLKLSFKGKQTRELLGQRDVTYNEAASLIGKAIGKPDLAYAELPASQLKPALVQSGMSDSMVDLLLEMSQAINSGHMVALESRSAGNTTPTSIEQFVDKVFAPMYSGKAAGA
ncbi:MAG TPA: NmrA family NAD(P)-binding protein [Terriglobia bacterium]|nr:NmrA family NAD(P)-binding protein [Terriglobia bacterium]